MRAKLLHVVINQEWSFCPGHDLCGGQGSDVNIIFVPNFRLLKNKKLHAYAGDSFADLSPGYLNGSFTVFVGSDENESMLL